MGATALGRQDQAMKVPTAFSGAKGILCDHPEPCTSPCSRPDMAAF